MTVLSTSTTSTLPTLLDRLDTHADRDPSAPAFTFLGDDDAAPARELTFGDVSRASRAVAAALGERLRPGDRAMLLLPEGLDFVPAFLGCLAAGVIAVPAYPPIPVQSAQRVRTLQSIVAACDPSAVVSIGAPELTAAVRTAVPQLAHTWYTSVEELIAAGAGRDPAHRADADDIAFLQFTSGSTAMPKGVTVTHRALAHNEELIADAFGHRDGFSLVGWLPLFHDMGLIGNVLHPLWMGRQAVLMSPLSFIKRPVRWLRAISTYRATTSGGPNFAYDMCTRRIPEEACEGLDLSSWRVAFNGAEPVRSSTIAEFARRFERHGFDPAAAYPCYGMAEATLLVTGSRADAPHRELTVDADALAAGRIVEDAGGRELVSSGIVRGERTVRIVDPETRTPADADRVGEVWIGGPSLPVGYWGNAEATRESFQAVTTDGDGPYMRSGDLGFVHDGELFITGRTKDLIIVGGRNHYPPDIEATAEDAHTAVRPGAVAAFGVTTDGGEAVVLVVGVGQGATGSSAVATAKAAEIRHRIRAAVAAAHGVPVADVVLVAPNAVPRTSSGKIRRRSCRDAYLDGHYADPGTDTDTDRSTHR
ncbi:fatty acyl-AMP ligase [Pseudonocardia alaniniphila]|uniref:Fatty acyl-AMP ligase n=1 Tax=Pseudonocardia alaniniphila TaxID=75291 RepID=A0ABS9T983_9PSEU|nr:fatty acyl-AMP ligase [Pseudonocardia alaniniphila]MCH6165100.1 fatty acyl-AMP ligase [Pseudonocardia alaniniphila]